ncbi:MAG TPA: 2-dehydropantoate 2-reductase [Myxococcales bacterium]|nr:2-dehydropantoate 2-reductase [Myxococcales bacterium]
MKVAMVGAGGVGGYFGGHLARAGVDVCFIARGAHLAAIRERGLEITGPEGSFLVHPAKATADAAELGVVDVVFVAVKTWQLPELAPKLRPLVGPGTSVIPLLNGIDAPAQLAEALGAPHVLGGLCAVLSFVARPGVVEHLAAPASLSFGELRGGRSERVEAIRHLMVSAGLTATTPDDITAAMWKKFAFITSFGGVGGVTRAPAGAIRGIPATRELLQRAVAEVVAVGRARGVAFPEDQVAQTLAFVDGLPPGSFASLPRELFAGKRTELDAWNGAVVRLGREAGVATPLHDFIYRSLLPWELRARGEVQFS